MRVCHSLQRHSELIAWQRVEQGLRVTYQARRRGQVPLQDVPEAVQSNVVRREAYCQQAFGACEALAGSKRKQLEYRVRVLIEIPFQIPYFNNFALLNSKLAAWTVFSWGRYPPSRRLGSCATR